MPSQTSPEVCLLSDSKSMQADMKINNHSNNITATQLKQGLSRKAAERQTREEGGGAAAVTDSYPHSQPLLSHSYHVLLGWDCTGEDTSPSSCIPNHT